MNETHIMGGVSWDRCFRLFPCLSDPARRSAMCLKVALVMLHLFYLVVLLIFDKDFVQKFNEDPWYTASYLCLFAATIAQYFITSYTSPGYVLDAMRAFNETEALSTRTSTTPKQPASSKNGSVVITVDRNDLGRSLLASNTTSWTKFVMELYPPVSLPSSSPSSFIRNWTCTYCNVLQPPRAKHCHDCDKCVLQFDHHCVWLGTCIGQKNHCRFWWYIFEETALCLWTGILYISYLKSHISKSWWIDIIMILQLATLSICLIFLLLLLLFHSYLVMTNQTTYELVRRRRIQYLRGIPERVYPFSKGVCRNLYNFCFVSSSKHSIEPLPRAHELEEMSRPYTCLDVLSCRCCC